jgi:hypothetical protein
MRAVALVLRGELGGQIEALHPVDHGEQHERAEAGNFSGRHVRGGRHAD